MHFLFGTVEDSSVVRLKSAFLDVIFIFMSCTAKRTVLVMFLKQSLFKDPS